MCYHNISITIHGRYFGTSIQSYHDTKSVSYHFERSGLEIHEGVEDVQEKP